MRNFAHGGASSKDPKIHCQAGIALWQLIQSLSLRAQLKVLLSTALFQHSRMSSPGFHPSASPGACRSQGAWYVRGQSHVGARFPERNIRRVLPRRAQTVGLHSEVHASKRAFLLTQGEIFVSPVGRMLWSFRSLPKGGSGGVGPF